VGMDLYPYTYSLGIRYPADINYPSAYYNNSIQYQTTILLHFKKKSFQSYQMIILTPNNISWIKLIFLEIYNDVLNLDDPYVRYSSGNRYKY
jgi:hypothetical protein